MRLLNSAAAFAFFVLIAAAPAMAFEETGVHGFWQPPDGGRIEITNCGDKLCGFIRPDKSASDQNHSGFMLLQDFTYKGDQKWRDGNIHNPEDGNSYSSTLRLLSVNELRVKGCLLIFCGSQVWTRID